MVNIIFFNLLVEFVVVDMNFTEGFEIIRHEHNGDANMVQGINLLRQKKSKIILSLAMCNFILARLYWLYIYLKC